MSNSKLKSDPSANGVWTFLSNHAHVLLCIRNSKVTMKEIASEVGITERTVQRIVADLAKDKYVICRKAGRRNHYEVDTHKSFRHPLIAHQTLESLVMLIWPAKTRVN